MAAIANPPDYLDDLDYAVVVGINHYPHYSGLQGPVNDARKFVEWVLSTGSYPSSGPIKQIIQIYSNEVPVGHPWADEIYAACADLVEFARPQLAPGQRLARRLYLFFAGHGIGSDDLDEACLLMGNARASLLGLHVPGKALAQYFTKTGLFSEVVLFMDCCRTRKLTASIATLPFNLQAGTPPNVTRFTAFAAPWGDVARERPFPPQQDYHGVFTKALLSGLSGAAVEDGRITGSSLAKHIQKTVSEYLDENYQPPQIAVDPNREIVFLESGAVPIASLTQVTVVMDPKLPGKVQLLTGEYGFMEEHPRAEGSWMVPLSMGLYRLFDPVSGRKIILDPSGAQMTVNFETGAITRPEESE